MLKINPASVEGLVLAGGLAAQMPVFMGGDRGKAETLLKRALEIDPRLTGGRLQLAQLYIATKRWPDAERELQSIVDETCRHGSSRLDDERPAARQGPAHRAPRPRPDPRRHGAVSVAVTMGATKWLPHTPRRSARPGGAVVLRRAR